MPKSLKESISHLEGFISDIEKEMDGVSLPKSTEPTRWHIASTSLYLATQHASTIILLIQRHDNEAAGLHLRTIFEIYIRLVYMMSGGNNSRLVAVLYADAVRYERYSKEVKKANLDALEFVSGETQNRLTQLNNGVEMHIKDTKRQEKVYREQLQSINHEEFLDDNKKLKSGDSISTQLSIKYMCRNLYDTNGKNLLDEYASIYGNLSMYAHTSTVYLANILHKQPDGNIRIGTVSSESNEEASIRNIAMTHHYLAGIFLQCLREKGLSQQELSARLVALENGKSKYEQFLTI